MDGMKNKLATAVESGKAVILQRIWFKSVFECVIGGILGSFPVPVERQVLGNR